MKDEFKQLKKDFEKGLKDVSDIFGLEELEQKFFGRKSGYISNVMKSLKDMEVEVKKELGKMANEIKSELLILVEDKKEELEKQQMSQIAEAEAIDVTQPGLTKKPVGHVHPLSLGLWEMERVARDMGFIVEDGPELESDYYNFQAVNIPPHHPARDGHDTFYIKGNKSWVMRTQMSDMQVRLMNKYNDGGTKSVRAAYPGRCFRNEAIDATHEHTFYQFEALVVDKGIDIGNLVGIIQELLKGLFRREVKVQLRPSYFPFVEPGFELDMLVDLGKGDQWVEMLGCGLMHPDVLKEGGYNPNEWQGLAFGMGLNRLVMAKYGIEDIRHFQSGDLRFLEQF